MNRHLTKEKMYPNSRFALEKALAAVRDRETETVQFPFTPAEGLQLKTETSKFGLTGSTPRHSQSECHGSATVKNRLAVSSCCGWNVCVPYKICIETWLPG